MSPQGLSLPSWQRLRLCSPGLPRPPREAGGSPRLCCHLSGPHHQAPRKLTPREAQVSEHRLSQGLGAFLFRPSLHTGPGPWLTSAQWQARLWLGRITVRSHWVEAQAQRMFQK